MVVQHRWVKPAGEPADFVDGLARDFPQPISLRLDIGQVSSVFQSTQADQQRSQQLAGFIMQFTRNPESLLLLGGKHVFEEESTRRFGLLHFLGLLAFLLAQIGYHHAQGVALVARKPIKRQINRNQTSISAPQVEFAFRNRLLSLGKKSFKSVSLCFRKQRLHRNSDQFLLWPGHQF
jgi:hypothetical protein